MIKINTNSVVVFDLDDVLFSEFDYLRSAFWKIAEILGENRKYTLFNQMMSFYFNGDNVFDKILEAGYVNKTFDREKFLHIYRHHEPSDITLSWEVKTFLDDLKISGIPIGIISDGRSITQRNKIKALGLNLYTSDIVISEEVGYTKPSEKGYSGFMQKYPDRNYIYIGDNYNKDFIAPNRLGWMSIALENNGLNINYKLNQLTKEYYPKHVIRTFRDIQVGHQGVGGFFQV